MKRVNPNSIEKPQTQGRRRIGQQQFQRENNSPVFNNLFFPPLTDESPRAIAAALQSGNLIKLDVNPISNEGARAIAAALLSGICPGSLVEVKAPNQQLWNNSPTETELESADQQSSTNSQFMSK